MQHLDNHRKYVRKGLDQLEKLDLETKIKFQFDLIFLFSYFMTQRGKLKTEQELREIWGQDKAFLKWRYYGIFFPLVMTH